MSLLGASACSRLLRVRLGVTPVVAPSRLPGSHRQALHLPDLGARIPREPGRNPQQSSNLTKPDEGHRIFMTSLAVADAPGTPVPALYPAVIWLLLGGNFLMSAAAFAYPFMTYLVGERGHAATTVGAVLAAFGVGWSSGSWCAGG